MNASSLTEEIRKDLTCRLKKIEGQARGILGMIDRDGSCADILVQLSSLSSAARSMGLVLMQGCLLDCASSIESMNVNADVRQKIDEMAKAVQRFISIK